MFSLWSVLSPHHHPPTPSHNPITHEKVSRCFPYFLIVNLIIVPNCQVNCNELYGCDDKWAGNFR